MISPHRLKWNNIYSNELNILDIITDVAFDSDNGEVNSFLSRESVKSESYDGRQHRIYRYRNTEQFSPKFTFVKRSFTDFTQDELRQLLRWLTSVSTTGLLNVYYDNTEVVSFALIGNWTEINTFKIANGRTVGVTAVFEANTATALSDLYTITKTISSPTDNKITINIDTDEPQAAVYPRVTIKHNNDTVVRIADGKVLSETSSDMVLGTVYYNGVEYYWKELSTGVFKKSTANPRLATTSVKLTNKHTSIYNDVKTTSPTIVRNNNSTEKIVIDGANKIISSSSVNRIFGDDFENWRWLPLYDGKNEITVEGNCTVTLEYRVPLKVGEF